MKAFSKQHYCIYLYNDRMFKYVGGALVSIHLVWNTAIWKRKIIHFGGYRSTTKVKVNSYMTLHHLKSDPNNHLCQRQMPQSVFFFSTFYLTISHLFSQRYVVVYICIFEMAVFCQAFSYLYWVEHIQMFSYDTLGTYIF